jgi:hypothetical protein
MAWPETTLPDEQVRAGAAHPLDREKFATKSIMPLLTRWSGWNAAVGRDLLVRFEMVYTNPTIWIGCPAASPSSRERALRTSYIGTTYISATELCHLV